MSSELFAGMPGINIPRSKWKNGYNVTGTFKHGLLVPIDCIPVLPGDSIGYSLRDITRMQTPLAPLFGNIKQSFAAFFIPMRLVWEHAEEFFGANKTSSGYQTTTYEIPRGKFETVDVGSLSHYLGKPIKGTSETDADGNNYYLASVLKERCYYLTWSEYFRAQQITNPFLVDVQDGNISVAAGFRVGSFNGSVLNPGSGSNSLMKVAKEFDYFTASTISPQYGATVTLPLGEKAPVVLEGATFAGQGGTGVSSIETANSSAGETRLGLKITGEVGTPFSIIADLEQATAAKINDIRYAFAVQKYLERANFAGNYFFGILQVHYGVTSPDSRLQRPEFLGRFDEDILVHQVTSTAETLNSSNQTVSSVGNTGAVSVTASGDVNLFNKAFVEPGYILVLRWCRARQVYSQGIMREDSKKDRFEIYTPELCNLGDQATKTREIYWKASESDIFGYQEHWAEYRYRPDRVTGMLDPAGGSGQLKFWTLANEFTAKPQLNDTFIMEQRDLVDRALSTGSAVDEYLSDTFCNIVWIREMPVRTIPGLIDHFGAM